MRHLQHATRQHHASPFARAQYQRRPRRLQLAELGYSYAAGGADAVNLDLRWYQQRVERQIFSMMNGPLARDMAQTDVAFVTNGVDLKASWLPHEWHLLSFGINAWQMAAAPQRFLASPTPASPLQRNDPFRDGKIDALGFYLQDDIQFGRLNLLAGLRHDTIGADAAAINNGSVTRERFESSPRGDGYYYVGNPQIKPETATQFEVGIKGAGARVRHTLAAYRNRIADYITGRDVSGAAGSNPCPPANAAYCKETVNLGQATLTGVDAQIHWDWRPGQTLSAAYSRVRGDNDDLHEPLFQMPADELSLGWAGRLAPTWRLVARQDRVARRFARGLENPTPGFATLDLGATWQFAARQSLRLALRNAPDRGYHEHLADGESGREIEAPGRNLQLIWNGSF